MMMQNVGGLIPIVLTPVIITIEMLLINPPHIFLIILDTLVTREMKILVDQARTYDLLVN